MEKEMYIPTIGDEVTLTCDWRFSLYHEYRNEGMIKFIFPGAVYKWGSMTLPSGEKTGEYGSKIAEVELPKGAVLKVDRIYIRKGGPQMKEFDSVTFVLQSIPKKKIEVPDERSVWIKKEGGENSNYNRENGSYVKKIFIRSRVRFWVKLKDVNTMRFLMGAVKIEKDDKPVVRRLIRVIPEEEKICGQLR